MEVRTDRAFFAHYQNPRILYMAKKRVGKIVPALPTRWGCLCRRTLPYKKNSPISAAHSVCEVYMVCPISLRAASLQSCGKCCVSPNFLLSGANYLLPTHGMCSGNWRFFFVWHCATNETSPSSWYFEHDFTDPFLGPVRNAWKTCSLYVLPLYSWALKKCQSRNSFCLFSL